MFTYRPQGVRDGVGTHIRSRMRHIHHIGSLRRSGCRRDFTCSTLVNHGMKSSWIHLEPYGVTSKAAELSPSTSQAFGFALGPVILLPLSLCTCERVHGGMGKVSVVQQKQYHRTLKIDDQMTSVDRWSFKIASNAWRGELQDFERPCGHKWQWRHSAPLWQLPGFQNPPDDAR